RALDEDVRAGQELPEQVLTRLAADVHCHALLAGVVPPVIEAAVGVDRILGERAAPASGAPARRLDLDDPRAAVGEQLARELVPPIRQLDHGESVVDAIHVVRRSVTRAPKRGAVVSKRNIMFSTDRPQAEARYPEAPKRISSK